MGLVTITGTLATDETPVRSATSSFVIDVGDMFDTEQTVGTSYEMIATNSAAGEGVMWTVVQNLSETSEAVVRCYLDGTNYVFFPLPALGILLIPNTIGTTSTASPQRVSVVSARALAGSSTLRVIALFVA